VFIREIGADEANRELGRPQRRAGFVELVNGKDLSNWQGAVDSYEVWTAPSSAAPAKAAIC
jgi:hypothetical protein